MSLNLEFKNWDQVKTLTHLKLAYKQKKVVKGKAIKSNGFPKKKGH